MRYKITFSYDGTLFHGYQKQVGYRSVEECFEKALYDINNHTETKIYSSGRTDKGVHAKGQVAHFDIDEKVLNTKVARLTERELQGLAIRLNYIECSAPFIYHLSFR